ncbi:MAG: hypothetical protein HYW89_00495 [Candidatus Sungiibacteriota bacterium]|uniref:VanZ-like domain-containing protein n=1 Tax=Candidatus Sungiibacteriota bacterium TaxID=2750080 RepID=A0A7T5RJR4_9BACT|nr:MAG: hypothetical protein HYW89_00495 [Candidatus Sungbacteria bacterium]
MKFIAPPLALGVLFLVYFGAQNIFGSQWWFSVALHLTGGAVASWFIVSIWKKAVPKSYQETSWGLRVWHLTCGALALGFFWELAEYVFINETVMVLMGPLFYQDTMMDLFLDGMGGAIASLFLSGH